MTGYVIYAVGAAGVLAVTGFCLGLALVTRNPRRGLWERFLRWYTGRQIPQPPQPGRPLSVTGSGWYPQLPTLTTPATEPGQPPQPSMTQQVKDLTEAEAKIQDALASAKETAWLLAAFQRRGGQSQAHTREARDLSAPAGSEWQLVSTRGGVEVWEKPNPDDPHAPLMCRIRTGQSIPFGIHECGPALRQRTTPPPDSTA